MIGREGGREQPTGQQANRPLSRELQRKRAAGSPRISFFGTLPRSCSPAVGKIRQGKREGRSQSLRPLPHRRRCPGSKSKPRLGPGCQGQVVLLTCSFTENTAGGASETVGVGSAVEGVSVFIWYIEDRREASEDTSKTNIQDLGLGGVRIRRRETADGTSEKVAAAYLGGGG